VTLRPFTDRRGNLVDTPTHDDTRRLTKLIGRLELLTVSLPEARKEVDARITDAVHAQGQGGGSGISDTVARAAVAISADQNHHRALNQALRSAEDSVEHLRVEVQRCKLIAVEDGPPPRCPNMKLRGQHVPTADGPVYEEVLLRCDRLTAHKRSDAGLPIDYDRDGLCDECRAEANEAMRRAQIERGRRLRRKGAA
jgi:hypothetical protein